MASGRVSKVKGKVVDIPTPPTIGTATAGGESVSIAFTASSKGGPTRSYIAKSNPGNITATGSTSPINVTGLTVGTSYTISVAGVNETGTGEYSSASNSAVPTVSPGSYESIATVTVGSGGSSSITFSSIPQTYKHLQIRAIATTPGVDGIYDQTRFNSDTGSNYSWHMVVGRPDLSPTAQADAGTSQTHIRLFTWGGGPYGTGTTGYPAVGIADILDYTDTNKYTTTRGSGGGDSNLTVSTAGFASGAWRNTDAITSITLTAFAIGSATTFAQHSHFALYGIKG